MGPGFLGPGPARTYLGGNFSRNCTLKNNRMSHIRWISSELTLLYVLQKRRASEIGGSAIEGFAVGQASLEDVFLEFASRGSAQSDAQMMAMGDALFAHRLRLSKKDAEA